MAKYISKKRRASLIRDILSSEHDVVQLAAAHQLSPDELAQWVGVAENHQCLTGLCVLADLQTQVLLSRYRLLAATRLIRLATQEDEQASADVARRACVDLLKLDLKRADAELPSQASEHVDASADDTASLRKALYGDDTVED